MKNPNVLIDDNASKSKTPTREPLSQATSVAQFQFQAQNEVGQEAAKMPKPSKKSQKRRNSMKEVDSSQSPTNGLPGDPLSTNTADKYRALRHNYLILEQEAFSLKNELKQIECDVKKLEEEKCELLDKLVVLEGLVEGPDFDSPT